VIRRIALALVLLLVGYAILDRYGAPLGGVDGRVPIPSHAPAIVLAEPDTMVGPPPVAPSATRDTSKVKIGTLRVPRIAGKTPVRAKVGEAIPVTVLWIRGNYLGRFDAEDTGRLIKGGRIDIWRPDCKAAIQWGRKKGVARLVQ
jgi:3D (Asp-Asp-Asp) domain-containing protein